MQRLPLPGRFRLALAAAVLAVAHPVAAQPAASTIQLAEGEEFYALVEIPAGSMIKYEVDPASGRLIVDRFQSMPVAYPANYGYVPDSLAGDGDALDILVYTREPIVPGAYIRVRAIGILRMIDGGEEDDKLIAVPADRVDPTYAAVRDIADLPAIERERLEAFFRVYKDLPAGRKKVELRGIEGAHAANQAAKHALGRKARP